MNLHAHALGSDSFVSPQEAVVLLGFSSIVDFAKNEGFRTAVVSSGFSLEDIFRVDHPIRLDPEDEAGIRTSLMELHARHKIRGVLGFDDGSVLIAAKVGESLQLEHVPPVSAVRYCIRKDEMRRVFANHPELAVPYRTVEHESEISGAVDEIGLPCVVKPVDSSNSRYVEFCPGKSAAVACINAIFEWAAANGKTRKVLIEPYFEGEEFSVECFTHDGETAVIAICEKILGPLPYFVEIGHYCPTRQSRDVERSLAQLARRALEVLGVSHLVTHTELRRTRHGDKIIEINPRPAGGKLPEFIRTITGYDLHEATVQLALGRRPSLRPARASHGLYHCLTTDIEGTVSYNTGYLRNRLANGLYPVVELMVRPGERVYPVNHKDGKILGRILAYGNGADVLQQEVRKVLNELQFQITPAGAPQAESLPLTTYQGQVGVNGAQPSHVAAIPAWVPGYGWMWLPLAGQSLAPSPGTHPGYSALSPPVPTDGRASAQPGRGERDASLGLEAPYQRTEKGLEVAVTAPALARPDPLTSTGNSPQPDAEKSSCCGGSSDDAQPEQKSKMHIGSGAWERGCC